MKYLIICLLLTQILSQTTTGTTTGTTTTNTTTSPTGTVYGKHGADWTELCATGLEQSPIDIEVVKGTCDNSMVLDVQFDKRTLDVDIEKLPYTIESMGNFSNLYATDVNGDLYGYTASQFHFHSPSEHYLEGQQYALEMHIVHALKDEFKAPQRNKAVLGILFEVNADVSQPFFETYKFSDLNTANSTVQLNISTLLGSQIDENPVYYTYAGSLTSQPCSEVVNWYILNKVLPITQNQLNQFNSYFSGNLTFAQGNGNNRELQPLNGRTVKKGGVVCEEQFVYFFSFFILYIFINYFIFKLL